MSQNEASSLDYYPFILRTGDGGLSSQRLTSETIETNPVVSCMSVVLSRDMVSLSRHPTEFHWSETICLRIQRLS